MEPDGLQCDMHTNEMTEATTGTVQNCKALYAKLRTQEDGVERTRLDLAREIHKAMVEGTTQVVLGDGMGCGAAYVGFMNRAWLLMVAEGVQGDPTRVQEFYRKAQEPTPDYPGKPGPKPAAKPVAITPEPEVPVAGNTPEEPPVSATGCPVEQGKPIKALKGVLDAFLEDCDPKSATAAVELLEKYIPKFNQKR